MPFARRQLLAGALAAGGAAFARRVAGESQAPGRSRAVVIDTHAHYYPADWVDLVQREGPANGAKIGKNARGEPSFSVPGIDAFFAPPYIDLDIRLKKMEAQGVDVQALSLTSPMVYWAPAAFGLKLSQVYNDGASAAHVKHPKRFVAMATLPMQAPDRRRNSSAPPSFRACAGSTSGPTSEGRTSTSASSSPSTPGARSWAGQSSYTPWI